MADLLDIAPATSSEAVTIGDGRSVDVRLLNANDVAGLLARFPNLLSVLVGGLLDVATMMASGGQAIAAVIAAGCGHLGDEKAEAFAGSFTIEDQAKLIDTIFRLSFPNGLSPVWQALDGIAATLRRGVDDAPKVVKMRLKPSPSPSPPSSDEVSRQTM